MQHAFTMIQRQYPGSLSGAKVHAGAVTAPGPQILFGLSHDDFRIHDAGQLIIMS